MELDYEDTSVGAGIAADADADGGIEAVDAELKADLAQRLAQAILNMNLYLMRAESRRLGDGDPTRVLAGALCAEGRRLLAGALGAASPGRGACCVAPSTLRAAYRLIAALASLASWSAPAAQESCALGSFPLAAPRDVVSYARYGCAETAKQESVYATLLGFDQSRTRLLLTSSGMGAYALIESFLLRDVLRPGDRAVLHPGVYFETQAQLRSLACVESTTAAGARREDLLAAIVAREPRVVFVDPLTNTVELRLLDLNGVLNEADRVCRRETWFVIDGTLLSGAFDPFQEPPRRHVRVLYYESGCKYLQFGLDLGPAGVVVVERGLAERFEQLRRGLGAIAPEFLVLPRASRRAYLQFLGRQTASAEAAALAVSGRLPGRGTPCIEAVFPRIASHSDHRQTACYPHCGGLLTFRFSDQRLNRRGPLESFIDVVMHAARAAQLPLTTGVSFGFRIPRISAAWSDYNPGAAFLRLSAGVCPARAARSLFHEPKTAPIAPRNSAS